MKTTELKNKLEKNNKFYNVILIDGPWGIGKTYFVKEFLLNKKSIYQSLFGIKELEEFKYGIYYSLSKIGTYIKKGINSIKGNSIGISIVSLPIPSFSFDLEKSIKKSIGKEQLVVVIDDLERISDNINFKELLGLIESLSQIDNISIIIICNSNKFENSNRKIFNDFKEKVVKKQYLLNKISEESINNIIEIFYGENIKKYISIDDYKAFVIEFYHRHNIYNLRTLQKAIIFSTDILNKIEDKLEEQEILELIKISFAISVEKNDRLYADREQTKNNENSFLDIYKNIDACILKKYFNESVYSGNRLELINYILNIYDDIEEEKNINNVINHFKFKKNMSVKNKDVFYCSDKQIDDFIKKFIDNDINKTSEKNVMDWFSNLNKIYPWIEIIHSNNVITDDMLLFAMDKYVDKIDADSSLFEIIDRSFMIYIENNDMLKYYNILKEKIVNKYIIKSVELINDKKDKNVFDEKNLDNLFMLFNDSQFVNYDNIELIINELKKCDYFIPNLNGEIEENTWGFAHSIWNQVQHSNEKNKIEFIEIVNKKLKNASNLGKYRMNSLNNQYGMNKVKDNN